MSRATTFRRYLKCSYPSLVHDTAFSPLGFPVLCRNSAVTRRSTIRTELSLKINSFLLRAVSLTVRYVSVG